MKVLTPEKEKELYDVLSKQRKSKHSIDIILTALNTGMRKREIYDLRKENVDFKNRIIHVTHTKNWEVRDIPMNKKLTNVLKRVIESSLDDNPYVFPNPKTGKPFTSIKTTFTKAVKRIGLEGFRFHDLRHTWCSRMCENGVAEVAIQKLGGWKTRSMINRYSHPSMDYMRDSVEKLNQVPLKVPLVEKDDCRINLTTSLSGINI